MSLRKLIVLSFIANIAYFGYSQGWLGAWSGDSEQREPARMSRQVNQDAIKISPAPAMAEVTPTAVAAPTTSPAAVEPAATSAPLVCTGKREQWLVYMGSYANKALLDKKKAELNALGLASNPISKPTLKLGLSLGEYNSEAAARDALTQFAQKGVKTATVVLWAISECP